MEKRGKKIFNLLAKMLEYPTQRIIEQVRDSITILDSINSSARRHVDDFRKFCLTNSLSRLEQIYSETFDFRASCSPYIGYYLFDHDHIRNMFVIKLKEQYGSHVTYQNEIPDHITVMLRSLVVQDSVEEARDIIGCCLIPAVKKMITLFKDSGNPYRRVLLAVLLTLETEQ